MSDLSLRIVFPDYIIHNVKEVRITFYSAFIKIPCRLINSKIMHVFFLKWQTSVGELLRNSSENKLNDLTPAHRRELIILSDKLQLVTNHFYYKLFTQTTFNDKLQLTNSVAIPPKMY